MNWKENKQPGIKGTFCCEKRLTKCFVYCSEMCFECVDVQQLVAVPADRDLCQCGSLCTGMCNVQTSKNLSEVMENKLACSKSFGVF